MKWIVLALALIASAHASGPQTTQQTTTGMSASSSMRLPCAPPMFQDASGACICPPRTHCPPPCLAPRVVLNGQCVCPRGTYEAPGNQCSRCPPEMTFDAHTGRCVCPPGSYPGLNGTCKHCPPPRVLMGGQCICPPGMHDVSGRCVSN